MARETGSLPADVGRWGRFYVLAFVFSVPGEIAAWATFGYPQGRNIGLFQLAMTALDGVGLSILLVAIALALRDRSWARRRPLVGGGLAVFGGVVTAVVSEAVGAHILGWWQYPVAMPTIFGIGLWPIIAWALLPPLFFRAWGSGWGLRPTVVLVVVDLALAVLGWFLLSGHAPWAGRHPLNMVFLARLW